MERDELIQRMKAERGGSILPAFEFMAGIDSALLDAYDRLAVLNFNYASTESDRALSAKQKEIIAVALLAAIRGNTTSKHMERALDLGASYRELVEALGLAMHITGAPSMEFGLELLMELATEKAASQG